VTWPAIRSEPESVAFTVFPTGCREWETSFDSVVSTHPGDEAIVQEVHMPSITPFLWFDTDLAEPIAYYTSIFPDAAPSGGQPTTDDGPTFSATMELCGQRLMLLNGGPIHAGFTESISLFVSVETQDEVDDLWERLTANGGEPGQCGWLKDRYGLSWQIIPTVLGTLLGSSDRVRAQQATDAMMQMGKLDAAALQAAFDR